MYVFIYKVKRCDKKVAIQYEAAVLNVFEACSFRSITACVSTLLNYPHRQSRSKTNGKSLWHSTLDGPNQWEWRGILQDEE